MASESTTFSAAPTGSVPAAPASAGALPSTGAQDEVVELCRDLLMIDSTNRGNGDGFERAAAEYVAEKLAEVGLEPTLLESAPGRTSVITRVEGADPSRPPLLIHGHLDVVAADPAEWTHHPFGGEEADGCLWGRGAIDMKDMDAMTLAVVRDLVRAGRRPPRDLVVAFLADEEAGGPLGARWLIDNHADLFADCTEAISEVGGFSYTINDDLRLYLIQTAEKGMAWMKLTARGRAGHGSMLASDNAVTALAEAVTRVGRHRFPVVLTPTVHQFLDSVGDALGIEIDTDDLETTVAKLGALSRMIGATISNTANPTQLNAGHKVNVIPGEATAGIDGRFLPGHEEEFIRQIDDLIGPDIRRAWVVLDRAVETPFEGPMVDAMAAALRAEDPGARAVPYMLSGGTDAKSFSRLGIRCFGFSPLRLPPDLDFSGMFHGVDERVPTEALKFGTRVLDRFLAAS
ncbi:M20/M25/M40 family metallo-hydrolase [Frankia sp. CNm7]|uniref:M20/M25/M40 family metallo-hydrolase n=1 Tax=Frankia nepalensis TaxID=1836974 RepID=A0A937UJB1_9ACTN|nr:M20/M25/M40 family metallo-hydrolase [Frankia nepalensis]MBL7501900.1 M20/M25/M40 family metallo-hydrolase [Frankia nepalensis]MBL7513905.1 M20/M25/M40 family metallo-hydrolase [Frankia nepalensis]MBL7522031.1 M20/M25/M40 family metallo-hydrolase [Frankia nepalensis]MBL7625619.1 M20/M25/M40 family metallo-hydrolase [Frankia nepalensis]